MSSTSQPDETRLRLRAFVVAQFTVLLVVSLVVAAAGAGLVYTTYIEPGTATETRTVSSLTVESQYDHAAEVTRQNPVFDTGTVLENRNTYFTRIAPVLDVAVQLEYAAASASDVAVSFDSTLVIRNVGEEGTVYWTSSEVVASETVSDVAPGETAAASFAINSSAVAARAAAIEENLGASPGTTETVVVTNVTVEGTINGEPTTTEQQIEMTVTPGDGTYTVTDPGVQSTTTEETEQVTVEREYGPLRSIGGPVVYLLGAAGSGGLIYAKRLRDFELTPAEREYLSFQSDRSEFEEWITRIRLPDAAFDRPEATAESLSDLVDFAIDNDTGVVEDPTTGAFHAVADGCIYTYRPPSVAVGPSPSPTAESGSDGADDPDDAHEVTGSTEAADPDDAHEVTGSAEAADAAEDAGDGDSDDQD